MVQRLRYSEFRDRIDPSFGHWLAGFTDGEGCFQIAGHKTQRSYRCSFTIALRADDAPVLRQIQVNLPIGLLIAGRARGTTNSSYKWSVGTKAGCLAWCEFLTEYPLRSKKLRDFTIWSSAVQLWAQTYWSKHHDRDQMLDTMAQLQHQLREGRQYGSKT